MSALKEVAVRGRRYGITERLDGRIQVVRITPYDETEYHWALSSNNKQRWQIIRDKKVVDFFLSDNPEEAALACAVWDDSMRLKRTGGIH